MFFAHFPEEEISDHPRHRLIIHALTVSSKLCSDTGRIDSRAYGTGAHIYIHNYLVYPLLSFICWLQGYSRYMPRIPTEPHTDFYISLAHKTPLLGLL